MNIKKSQFPPISGKMDLPANIYFHTITYKDLEDRRKKGYKLVLPIAYYRKKEEYLSIGAEGFFLARLMEKVSENVDIVLYYPVWIEKSSDFEIKENIFGFDTFYLYELSDSIMPNANHILSVEDVFNRITTNLDYKNFRLLLYLGLIPEMVHIEKIRHKENINFSLYNDGLEILENIIIYYKDLLK